MDIIIIGGGPIGYTAALHLAAKGISVTVLDEDIKSKSVDGRVLALSYASYAYLNSLGIWVKDAANTFKIEQVHISHDGFGRSIIDASDVQLPCLGFTVKYVDIMRMLGNLVDQTPKITRHKCRVTEIASMRNYATIKYVKDNISDSISTNLAIVAEGGGLEVNGVEYRSHDYKQMAIVATIRTQNQANTVAYERFGGDGSFVLLPYNSHFVLVLSVDINANNEINNEINDDIATPEGLTKYLASNKFFARFGKINVDGRVHSFPLYKRIAETKALDSVFIVGNSAQTLHPVSAQGLNLGLRDVRILCENIHNDRRKLVWGGEWFNKLRKDDTKYIVNFTHNLAQFIDIDLNIIKHLRGLGIVLLSNCKPLQNKIGNNLIFGI